MMRADPTVRPIPKDGAQPLSWRTGGFFLLLLLGAAGLLRLWGLGGESAWWDEYTSLKYLDAPSLGRFLTLNRTLDPATLPLYYAFQYCWWHHVSASVYALRCFSILLGLMGVAALFDLGRKLFGARAGLIAAACMALSPIHAFHAQGIRMYVLLTLLAILSIRTFVEIAEGGKARWWLAHAAVNFLLLWTHPFAALLLAVEGVALVAWAWPNLRRMVGWGVLHGAIALPSAWYFMTVRFWPAQQTENWLKPPGPRELFGDVFADDVLSWTYQLRVCADAFHGFGSRIASMLMGVRPVLDTLAIVLFAGAALLGVVALFRDNPNRRRYGLLLLWMLLPPLMLFAASRLYRPCMFPRYTLYCSLALYLLIGAAVSNLHSKPLRRMVLVVFLVLFGYQAGLAHPGPQRTDWLGAARMILGHAGTGDVVLVQTSTWKDVFVYSAGALPQSVASAETLDVLANETAFLAKNPALLPANSTVWVLLLGPYFDSGLDEAFEALLNRHQLPFDCHILPGIEPIRLYAIKMEQNASPVAFSNPDANAAEDFRMATVDLAMAMAEKDRRPAAKTLLERLPGIADPFSLDAQLFGSLYTALKEDRAIDSAIMAVRAYVRGAGYMKNQNYDRALQAFTEAGRSDPAMVAAQYMLDTGFWIEAGLTHAERGQPGQALELLRHIKGVEQPGHPYGNLVAALRDRKEVPPHVAALRAFLQGTLDKANGRNDAAVAAFRRATEHDPDLDAAWNALARTLLAMKDFAVLPPVLEHLVKSNPSTEELYGPLRDALQQGQSGEAQANALLAFLAGTDLFEAARYEEAARQFLAAIEALPGWEAPEHRRILALVRQGDPDSAREQIERAHHPGQSDFAEVGMAYAEHGQTEEALAMLLRIPGVEQPGNPNERLYGNLVSALRNKEKPDMKIQAVRAFLRGSAEKDHKRFDLAAEAFRQATELDPALLVAWHALGRALVAQQDLKAAGPVFQHVVEANPGDAIVYGHLADVLVRGGDAQRALAATDTLLRGIAAMEQKDDNGLRNAVDESLRLDDGYGLAYLVRAVFVDWREGHDTPPIDALHRAFALDSAMARFWQPFYAALLETKNYATAWNELRRLEKLGIPPPDFMIERLRAASGRQE
jgi:tetratricopeptide (TPR) repeat protein/uncharacterized membrane protein